MSDQASIFGQTVDAAKLVIDAMHKQRLIDAKLIREYADQMPDDHPAKKYLYEVSETLVKQVKQ